MRTKPLQQTSMGVIQSDSRSWIIYIFFLLDSSYRQTSPSHTHTHITIIFITQRALKCAGREKLFKQQKLFKCQSPEIRRRRRSKDVTKKKKKRGRTSGSFLCKAREIETDFWRRMRRRKDNMMKSHERELPVSITTGWKRGGQCNIPCPSFLKCGRWRPCCCLTYLNRWRVGGAMRWGGKWRH